MKNQKVIINTVAGLTILTVVAVLIVNIFPEIGDDNFRKWGLGVVLAEIIGLFVLITRTSLKGRQVSIFLTLPADLVELPREIIWDPQSCFVVSEQFKEKITLLKSDIGPGYKVHFNSEVSDKVQDIDVIEFELKEQNGKKWRVGPFNLYDLTRNLEYLEPEMNLNYD